MGRTYVGTANHLGLEFLVVEDDDAVESVVSRIKYQGRRPRVCFWVSLSDEAAVKIGSEYRAGERMKAVRTLEAQAVEIGPLLSPFHSHTPVS